MPKQHGRVYHVLRPRSSPGLDRAYVRAARHGADAPLDGWCCIAVAVVVASSAFFFANLRQDLRPGSGRGRASWSICARRWARASTTPTRACAEVEAVLRPLHGGPHRVRR
ncbi:MAG: hypothetical protein MZW92_19985 [Comamonadaceae bacterium]|nr:hypothetical protein [Comamonadaceae bacterium]